jgi:hypothetical protein
VCEEPLRVDLAGNQRAEDRPATRPEEIGDDAVSLRLSILERLLDAQCVLCHLADELLAGAREVAQRLDRHGWDKTRADQPVGERSASQTTSFTSLLRPGTDVRHFVIGTQLSHFAAAATSPVPWNWITMQCILTRWPPLRKADMARQVTRWTSSERSPSPHPQPRCSSV